MKRIAESRASQGGWIIGFLVLGGALAWWWLSQPAPVETTRTAPSVDRSSPSLISEVDQKPPVARRLEATEGKASHCVDQQLDVTSGAKHERSCMSRTQVIQNGNVRTYRVESQGGPVRSALVDAAGEQILRAEVSMGSGDAYACGASRCPGISFGSYDSQGARPLIFSKARLSRGEVDESIVVDGRLLTIPDDQLSASSCAGEVLLVNRGASTLHFCPDSGTGFDLNDDGSTTYRFTNHDGTTLGVSIHPSGALKRVEFGVHECQAPACSGVSVGPADPAGGRKFSFGGTSLLEKGSGSRAAILNGVVALAPQ